MLREVAPVMRELGVKHFDYDGGMLGKMSVDLFDDAPDKPAEVLANSHEQAMVDRASKEREAAADRRRQEALLFAAAEGYDPNEQVGEDIE